MKRPFRLYLAIMLLVAGVITGGRTTWEQAVRLGCLPTGGLSPANSWLDNCDSDRIGDYAHSALWFGLEPAATAALLKAKVFFFGDSRMLDAMSEFSPGSASNSTQTVTPVSAWFAARRVPYYLLAFNYGEQSGWIQKLLTKVPFQPSVMIFDTAPYFTGGQSIPARAIESDPDGELKTALETKSFLAQAATYCGYLPWLCGRTASNYRVDMDGHVFQPAPERIWFGRRRDGNFPITQPPPADTSHFQAYLDHARALLVQAKIDPHCAVFTTIPNSDLSDSLARFLAERLGGTVISPQLTGLASVDHWHLSSASAQRWVAAFLSELEPVLNTCAEPAPSQQAVHDPG